MKRMIWLCALLVSVGVAAAPGVRPHHENWIVEGPWDTLPAHSTEGLRLDPESRGMTLPVSLSEFRFLLEPDPGKGPTANGVASLASSRGLLCLGYGDLFRNLGPVDALCLDPVGSALLRLAEGLPEESVGGLTVAADRTLILAGEDAREPWNFGNIFLGNERGLTKRRTVPGGVHVFGISAAHDRWFARYQPRAPIPVDYPFVLVSEDRGSSWTYEPVDDEKASYVYPLDVDAVGTDEVYAVLVVHSDTGGSPQRIYRFDGQTWTRFWLEVPEGTFLPQESLAFRGGVLIRGGAFDQQGKFVDSTHFVEAGVPRALPFLHDRYTPFWAATVHDGFLYLVEYPQGEFPLRPYTLHRTADLEAWETLGEVGLLPGARPFATAVSHGRLFVGAQSFGGGPDPTADYELPIDTVPAIQEASLLWSVDLPEGSSARLQVRTGRNSGELLGRPFVGPDGTTASFFTESGQALSSIHRGDTSFQVRVLKTTPVGQDPAVVHWVALRDTAGTRTVAAERGQGLYGARIVGGRGRYSSPIYRLLDCVTGGRLSLEAATPGPSRVELRVRSGGDAEELLRRPFVGPDGTSDTAYGPGEASLWTGHDGDLFLQFEAVLVSPDDSVAPMLRRVAIETRGGELAKLVVRTRLDEGVEPENARGWTAGKADLVRVTAMDKNEKKLAVRGEIELTAWDAMLIQSRALRPDGLRLPQGAGTGHVTIEHAGPTRICARLGEVSGCSEPFVIDPADAAGFDLATSLNAPRPWWSPVGRTGDPFRLTIRAIDRYGNPGAGFVGSVECRLWQEFPVDPGGPPLLFMTLASSDGGCVDVEVVIDNPGEFNVVCRDVDQPSIAGSVTVVMN